jgi:hypothetical protein
MNREKLLKEAARFNLNLIGFLPSPNYYSEIKFYENKGWICLQTSEELAFSEFEINPESLERVVEEILIKIGKGEVKEEVLKKIWEEIERSKIIFEGKAKEIIEKWSGTRGSYYYYVVEDKTLRHISNYSIYTTSTKELTGRKAEIKRYIVPMNTFNKTVLEFSFSNSGYLYITNIRTRESINEEEIATNYSFEIKDKSFESMVILFKKSFLKMVEEVRNYSIQLNFEICFFGKARRVNEAFKNPQLLFVSLMALPSDESRKMSLNNVMRWIYQLWVLDLICESLECESFEKGYWRIEQGKPYPTCILNTPKGNFSIWFEPQIGEMEHLKKIFTRKREFVRPDLIICKGEYEDLSKVPSIDLLIECKHDEPSKWEKEVVDQLISYKEYFKPKVCMLVSFYEVPSYLKKELISNGVSVKDKLSIDALTEINGFRNEIKYILS